MDDKELDDLLESALDDFGKEIKIETSTTTINAQQETTAMNRGKVTIEKTQLYVDDVDYDDRPTSNKMSSSSSSSSKAQKSNTGASAGEDIDQMKLFDEIFNDAKTRETMKQFTEALSGLGAGAGGGEGDEAKLMENFTRVMSQLANENLDDDGDDDGIDNIEDLEGLTKQLEGLDFLKKLAEATAPASNTKKESTTSKKTTSNDDNQKESGATTSETSDAQKEDTQKSHMDKVLEDMVRNSEKVLNDSGSSAAASFSTLFSRLTSSLDDDSTGGGGDDAAAAATGGDVAGAMMEPFLSMLFSKDILYPSLKLMLENFDKYIDERKEKLNEEEMKKCGEQKECIAEMCRVYESMKNDDTAERKSENLKKILDLLEKCGMPPSELVPEVNPFDILENQAKPEGCPIS